MHKTERINAAKAEAEAILVVASATAASIRSLLVKKKNGMSFD